MTEEIFSELYWKQYLMIEKEFKTTFKYVALNKDNYATYSDEYIKLLLEIGSEIDVVSRKMCQEINSATTAKTIDKYRNEIIGRFPEFEKIKVVCKSGDLFPWKDWNNASPTWWKIYNGVKHNRNSIDTYNYKTKENYTFANQCTVLNALAGLYQLEQYLFTFVPHNPNEETPLPGSRLFQLSLFGWEKKHFGLDSLLYTDEGRLIVLYSEYQYADV